MAYYVKDKAKRRKKSEDSLLKEKDDGSMKISN